MTPEEAEWKELARLRDAFAALEKEVHQVSIRVSVRAHYAFIRHDRARVKEADAEEARINALLDL